MHHVKRIRRIAAPVFATLALLGLVACGSDDDDTSAADTAATNVSSTAGSVTTAAPAADAIDVNGVLRPIADLSATTNAMTWDPIAMKTPATIMHTLVYDTLLRSQLDGSFEPGLAANATIVDPQTITIELNPGIEFSDGTPLDAAAVKFSLERNAGSENGQAFSADLQQLESVTVESPLKATIHLKAPIAGSFYTWLGRGETMIVSPTAVQSGVDINNKPVGAGPFLLESFTAESSVKLVKNPHYFQADQIKLAGVEYVHSNNPTTTINALRSGAADSADLVPISALSGLAGSDLETRSEPSDSIMLWGHTCKSRPPLDDVRVRRALNLGVDRDAINQAMFGGRSEPQWGFWKQDSGLLPESLVGSFARDVNRAKALLAEAGAENLELSASVTPGDSQTVSEIIQQQWAEIGVKLTLVPTQNILQDALGPSPKTDVYFFPLVRSGLDKVTRTLVEQNVGNVCGYANPELNRFVAQLQALSPTSPEAKEAWAGLQQVAVDDAANIFGVFGMASNAWSPRVGNVEFVPNFQGVPFLDIRDAYIVAD